MNKKQTLAMMNKNRESKGLKPMSYPTFVRLTNEGKTLEELEVLEVKIGGARIGKTKKVLLTDKEFERAKKLHSQGFTLRELANSFGVSRSYFHTHRDRLR